MILFMLLSCCVTLCLANYQYDMKIVGGDCPKPCACLKYNNMWGVFCNQTGITTVPTGIPPNTQLLDLTGNDIRHVPRDAFVGLNALEELDMASCGLQNGIIEPGALELPRLKTVELSFNKFTTIPDFLPRNITKVWLYGNKITQLQEGDFVKYKSLEYLDVSQNEISTIEMGTFDILVNLTTLYIPFNKLTDASFPPNLFAKLTKLQMISLRFNKLQHILKNLPTSIQYLDYVGNDIRTIPAYAFQSLPNLSSMEFWQGQITAIEDNAFYGLSNLGGIDFMQNQISSTVTNLTFSGLTGLGNLNLAINNISKIEPDALRSLPSIRTLYLGGNHLIFLDPEVLNTKYIPQLATLYLEDNPWYCDCHLRWLREKVGNATYSIQIPHLITCAGPPAVAGKPWDQLQPSDFVC